MLSVTKRMHEYLREIFRRYNDLLVADAKQLEQINCWLRNKGLMRMMSFEWKVGICLMKREIKKNVQEVSDILSKLRKRFKFYDSC